jgi:hypothetical protein
MAAPTVAREGRAGTPVLDPNGRLYPAYRRGAEAILCGLVYRHAPGSRKAKARRLEVDESTQSKYELGRIHTPLEHCAEHARRLGAETAAFFAGRILAAGVGPTVERTGTEVLRQQLRELHAAETAAQSAYDPLQANELLGQRVHLDAALECARTHLAKLLLIVVHLEELYAREHGGGAA